MSGTIGNTAPPSPSGSLVRFDPAYWTADWNTAMVASIVSQAGSITLTTVFRTLGDLAAIFWHSADSQSHPSFRYATNNNYAGVVWEFDFSLNNNLPPVDDVNGLVLTVIHLDNAQQYVRLNNYRTTSGAGARSGHIKLDFNNVKAGFNATDTIDWTQVAALQLSVIPIGYVAGSSTPIDPNVTGWMMLSNFVVTGPRLAQNQTPFASHTLRMTDDYDDSGVLTPERIVKQCKLLGYSKWWNLYMGTNHFHQLKWSASESRFIVDPTQPVVNDAAQAWFNNLAQTLAANGFDHFLASISFEILQPIMPLAWAQRDYSGAIGRTGYTPPSCLITPSSTEALNYVKALFAWYVQAGQAAGLAMYAQCGEWWWWNSPFGPNVNAPCFYDAATQNAWLAAKGKPAPTPFLTSTSQPIAGYEEWLAFLADTLGSAVAAVKGSLKVPTTVLLFPPQILGSAMLEITNIPTKWRYPGVNLMQLEDYDYVISGDVAGHAKAWATVTGNLGYPAYYLHYFAGYVQNASDAVTQWPPIFAAATEAFQVKKVAEVFVWSRVQVFRDGVVWQDDVQPAAAPQPSSPRSVMLYDPRSVSTRSSPIPGVPSPPPPQLPISQLPLVSALFGGEMIPMVQNGVTVRASASLVGGVGAAPVFTQKVNSLYYQVSGAPQSVFQLSHPDMFGNTYNLATGPSLSIEVSAWGVRLTPTVDFLVDYGANTITLIQPAGIGQVVVIDFFAAEPGAAFSVEPVTVTSTNILAALSYVPDGKIIVVFVNHMAFFAVGSPPSFSLNGSTIMWSASEPITVNPGDNVIALYTHLL